MKVTSFSRSSEHTDVIEIMYISSFVNSLTESYNIGCRCTSAEQKMFAIIAGRLIMFYFFAKLRENISVVFKVIERIRFLH